MLSNSNSMSHISHCLLAPSVTTSVNPLEPYFLDEPFPIQQQCPSLAPWCVYVPLQFDKHESSTTTILGEVLETTEPSLSRGVWLLPLALLWDEWSWIYIRDTECSARFDAWLLWWTATFCSAPVWEHLQLSRRCGSVAWSGILQGHWDQGWGVRRRI